MLPYKLVRVGVGVIDEAADIVGLIKLALDHIPATDVYRVEEEVKREADERRAAAGFWLAKGGEPGSNRP